MVAVLLIEARRLVGFDVWKGSRTLYSELTTGRGRDRWGFNTAPSLGELGPKTFSAGLRAMGPLEPF